MQDNKSQVLAFDFGASSGRAMVGKFEDGKITLTEVHRFLNEPVLLRGTFYWDILRLFHEIKKGILEAKNSNYDIKSIGIDTWGVDFGLLDDRGMLLESPIHYRDARTDGMIEKACEIAGEEYIYNSTGIQFIFFNTLNQLLGIAQKRPELFDRAADLLFIPDLFKYFLTGEKVTEYTVAATSQLFNPRDGKWVYDLIEKLGIKKEIFGEITDPGTHKAPLSKDICEELSVPPIDVVTVAGHDTNSAVVAVPCDNDEEFLFISCGTWSIMGVELKEPLINEKTYKANMANEGGYGRTTDFLYNIIGLWLMQESRRQWEREGKKMSFKELDKHTVKAQSLKCFINPSDDSFSGPGNMPQRIKDYCVKSGQSAPESIGEVTRCITESLALEYRNCLEKMEDILGKKFDTIYIIGGGVQDKLLCQFTANATGRKVEAGPVEATALGNVVVQLIALGVIPDIKAGRRIIKESFPTDVYYPQDTDAWEEAYKKYLDIKEKMK